MSLSLYVHIPFCVKRCIYCDFVSGIYDPEKADAYVTALKKEIESIHDERPLSTLYIGGGTPTVLGADSLSDLISCIFGHFNFTEDHEATIEANPGTLDIDKLQTIHSAGINRISMGVQSFNDAELAFLGRAHSSEEAEQAVRMARDAGFKNIGIDLIYGIPGQDLGAWGKTLEKAVSLKPEHISTYELTVEKKTELHRLLLNPPPYKGGRSGDKLKPLEEDSIIRMYDYTIDHLTCEGYLHYEISNFAIPGFLSRHNLNYWDRGEYYGAGTGAHSFIDEKRSFNTESIDEYLKLVPENKSPVKGTEDVTGETALSEAIFLGLRKTGGIDAETFFRRYNVNLLTRYHREIKVLRNAGLIETACSDCSYETGLRLTRKGLLLSNEVFTKFM
jgi:oxygen-independent coproporphyrinogen-3 oxidase